tara:strand:+ start:3570 stop:5975 length:2406 start_codon:yes stop_codon:yes gene_type:complete
MEFNFIPVDFDYFDFEGKNFIKLIGRTSKGKKVCVIDSYEPNFWIILKDSSKKNAKKVAEKISKIEVKKSERIGKVLKTEILDKKFLGEKVKAIRVFINNHKDAHEIVSAIKDSKNIEIRREYDINLITKYIKEKNVEPLVWYNVKGETLKLEDFGGISDSLELDICIYAEKIKKLEKQDSFVPKILAYDIETDSIEIEKGHVLMVSLYGENFRKVLTWKKARGSQNYVECFKNEKEMLEKFVEYVNSYDPDILVGYFSDFFDLPYLVKASKKEDAKFSLGVDREGPSFGRGKIPTGKINGIVHIDLYRFISSVFSQYLQSETLSLNDVANELVGESKGDFDFSRLSKMKESDWKDFFSYNLQDSVVTYKLARKLWPDILEFSQIIKEPLFNITRSRMASHVENYILHNLDRFDEIAEKSPIANEIKDRRSFEAFEGAFVLEPTPGLYENLVVFDFTSMYASIIVSYNLSKSTYLGKDKFSKAQDFFPIMLSEIIEKRKKHKKEYSKNPSGILRARSNAYKLLANSSYGYQAFFGARYYCREAAASTAKFARKNILSLIKKIEKAGYKIIYGDTDSIAFLRGDKTKREIIDFLKKINSDLPGIMELDLEDFYLRGLFVSKRGGIGGAKKKYALINEKGNFKIRGFETIRRDWCKLTRNLQNDILRYILKDGKEKRALELLKKTINKLKKRDVSSEDLLIKTQIRKPLSEYLTEGPHVIAAKKMEAEGIKVSSGTIVRYFVGESFGKKKRIKDKVYLQGEKAKYDIEYYLNNQIIPSVENIFNIFGIDVNELINEETQKKLF